MDVTMLVRNRHQGGESWVDCVRVTKENTKPITFKLGQVIEVKRGTGCTHKEGVIETLLNPSHATRFIVAVFINGERAAFRYDEVVPVSQEPIPDDVIPGVYDPALASKYEPLL